MEQNTITRDDLMKRISKMEEPEKEAILYYFTMDNLYAILGDTKRYEVFIKDIRNMEIFANLLITGTEELHEWMCSTSDMPVDKVAEVVEEYKNLDVDSQTEFRKRLGVSKPVTDSLMTWYYGKQKSRVFS